MILGLISFCIFAGREIVPAEHQEWLLPLEFAHVVILAAAMMYVLSSCYFVVGMRRACRTYDAALHSSPQSLQKQLRAKWGEPNAGPGSDEGEPLTLQLETPDPLGGGGDSVLGGDSISSLEGSADPATEAANKAAAAEEEEKRAQQAAEEASARAEEERKANEERLQKEAEERQRLQKIKEEEERVRQVMRISNNQMQGVSWPLV